MIDVFDVPQGPGHHSVFAPGDAGIEWLGLEVARMSEGEEWTARFDDREAVAVVLSGSCTARAGDQLFEAIGGRFDVFAGPPYAVYVPPATDLVIGALGALEVAIVSARSDEGTVPALISPENVRTISVGRANWRRDVRLVVPPGSPVGRRLIVGETVNPPGNWSGIAPHKHDEVAERENALEECYLFKASPRNGFGVQLGYRDGAGSGHLIGNDQVTFIHRGFHPTVAAPGMTLFYLWTLAGERKDYLISLDPRFDWLPNAEAVVAELEHH